MYQLSRNQRFTILSNNTVAKLSLLTGPLPTNASELGLCFTNEIKVERAGERWWNFDLVTGFCAKVALDPETITYPGQIEEPVPRSTLYDIEIGQALITRRRNAGFVRPDDFASQPFSPRQPIPRQPAGFVRPEALAGQSFTESVTIYINEWFAENDTRNEDLDVARDACLACDYVRAQEVIGKVIPHSYELFIAAIRLESEALQARIA